jgi:hypothetical protein
MSGIGEVWYYSSKNSCFFHEIMVSSCRVMNTIACRCGIWIDQCMLGTGEVWYFSLKTGVFQEMMVSPCRVMNTIACCCGIEIDQSMLGIGEVWYFSSKTAVFSRNDGFTMPCDEQHCFSCSIRIDHSTNQDF